MNEKQNKDTQDIKEELIVSLIQGLESLVDLLEQKGIVTRKEYLEKINKLKAQRDIFNR